MRFDEVFGCSRSTFSFFATAKNGRQVKVPRTPPHMCGSPALTHPLPLAVSHRWIAQRIDIRDIASHRGDHSVRQVSCLSCPSISVAKRSGKLY